MKQDLSSGRAGYDSWIDLEKFQCDYGLLSAMPPIRISRFDVAG